MKQLKFMLAAATAISLATAAQAADQQSPLFTDDFDTRVVEGETLAIVEGTDATDLTGYSYTPEEGGTTADNESVVKAGGYSGNALQINTGTTPLLRDLDSSNSTGISLVDVKSVYIDTMVQFTVTPVGDTVTEGEEDKLMIYLQETNEVTTVDGVDVTNVVNKLMVKAALPETDPVLGTITGAGEAVDVVASAEDLVVLPNTWYNLKVYAKMHLGVPVFTIFIGETQLKSSQALIDGNDWLFPSLKGTASTSLKYVGFAGEGLVDNLTVATVREVTYVDFSFTWSDDRISAVTYTIGAVTDQNVTKGAAISGYQPGTEVTLTITPATWYKLASADAITYTVPAAVGPAQSLDDYVTEAATVDATTGNVTVTENTTATDLGITAGGYAGVTDTTVLGNLMTWATAATKGGATAATAATLVNSMTFDANDNPTSDAAKAYLLDCATDQVEAEADKFKLTISFDENGAPVVEGPDGAATYKNGKIVLKGRASLSEDEWATADSAAHNFFKAFLVK